MELNESVDGLIKVIGNYTSKEELVKSLKSLRSAAIEDGLSASQITTLTRIATCGKFNSVVSGQIIRCLIPRESVPEEVALLVLSKLCTGAQHIKVQHLLLRWIVLVFDLIATKTKLHALYSVVFHFIESEVLCPTVCHLLFLLTRKCDVTHHRILRLLNLQKKIGPQPYLCGLLTVYKMYQPSLVSMSGGYRVFFKKVDQLWEQAIRKVQQKYGLCIESEKLLASTNKVLSKKDKSLFSSPQPCMMQESQQSSVPISQLITDKVPMHRIKSFQEVLDHFGRLDLSCQSHTLFSSKTLQHVIAVTADRTVAIRLSFWLNHCLRNELLDVSGETKKGKELLETLLSFSNLIQECLPVCEAFLFRYLCVWNGADYRPLILKLITRLRLMPFETLHGFVLSPLYKLCTLSTNCYFTCSVVCVLTELWRNYISMELPKHEAITKMQQQSQETTDNTRHSIFPCIQENVDVHNTIHCLIKFVDDICVQGLECDENNQLLHFYYIQFYKQVSNSNVVGDVPMISLPPKTFVRKTLFSLNPVYMSSLCRILLNYKNATMEMKGMGMLNSSHQEIIKLLNQYLLDFYDTLWRRRAFHPGCSEESIVYKGLTEKDMGEETDTLPANRMFSIDRHPALVSYTSHFLSILHRDNMEALNAEFVLEDCHKEYLESQGHRAIPELINSLMS